MKNTSWHIPLAILLLLSASLPTIKSHANQSLDEKQIVHIVSDETVKFSYDFIEGWESIAFDDSSWSTVVAPSGGLCDPSIVTRIANSDALPVWGQDPQEHQTIYARKTFTIQNPISATIQTLVDDDFDLYVNGLHVRSDWDGVWSYFDDEISGLIQAGENVIAIKATDSYGICQNIAFDVTVEEISETEELSLVIEQNGNFFSLDDQGNPISIDGQSNAQFPYRVRVTKDNAPVTDVGLMLVEPFEAFIGTTDANGIVEASLEVPMPPQEGEFNIEVEATVDGEIISSGMVEMYSVLKEVIVDNKVLTSAEAFTYTVELLTRYAARPGPPCPEYSPNHYLKIACWLLKQIDFMVAVNGVTDWEPRTGDVVDVDVFEYSLLGQISRYVVHAMIVREGTEIYNQVAWYLNPPEYYYQQYKYLNPRAWGVIRSSPITLFIIDPTGKSAGIDPNSSNFVFEYPLAISDTQDDPYLAVLPSPIEGEYTLIIMGTGSGPYNLTIFGLDENGEFINIVEVSGLTYLGEKVEYKIQYEPLSETPLSLTILGVVDIKPDALNLKSEGGQHSITAYIELPIGFDVGEIELTSILLNGMVPAQENPTEIGDSNNNGIDDLMVKFDRQELINLIKSGHIEGSEVTLSIRGIYSETIDFTAEDTILINN